MDANASPSSERPARFTYPRAARLLQRSEFDQVYRQGRRRSSKHFVVFSRANRGGLTRFGVSVKKAVGPAVARNRIRRRIREIVRRHRQEIQPGWDIVIHPRSSVARADFQALATELLGLIAGEISPGTKPTA